MGLWKSQLLACLAIMFNKAVYMDKELNALIGLELKSQMMDSRNDVLRTNKSEKSQRWSLA